jgi:hypothetical protein
VAGKKRIEEWKRSREAHFLYFFLFFSFFFPFEGSTTVLLFNMREVELDRLKKDARANLKHATKVLIARFAQGFYIYISVFVSVVES